MRRPSGAHAGWALPVSRLTCRSPVPSARTTKIDPPPSSVLSEAISPSGPGAEAAGAAMARTATNTAWRRGTGGSASCREALPVGAGGGLASGADVELRQDVRDVHARGLAADHEPVGDLPVAEAVGQEREHLLLPAG